ncbi:MAG TPA: MauE/DoxX family redox-associated membrane protein [Candidatus Binatia bacterium]|nr:MauE/DoxX family redox-associated membrane protein [Candidatus Binatia bacterium]
MSLDPAIDATLRALFALLFANAAWQKLAAPGDFRAAVREYHLVPGGAVAAVAVLLVAAEVAVATALGVPALRTAALRAVAALLLVYAGAIGINLARGRAIDCGCGGPAADRPISAWLVARNVALATVALAAAGPVGSRPLVWVDALTIAAATAAVALLYAATDRLAHHAPALAALRESS